MARKTIIVGNGLSLALNNEHFLLANAIQHIWDDPEILGVDEKRCILQCLIREGNHPPEGEHELDVLQLAVTACGFLARLEGEELLWLSNHGRDFPETISKFIHKVATQLHLYEGNLPDAFIEPLCEFLRVTKSHIATLNYDRLLYDEICDRGLVKGYSGYLVDGMLNAGFKPDNLKRNRGRNFGYYLHLHGSPLFHGNENPKKLRRGALNMATECDREHIVLTHIKHKMSVVESSVVLSAYWEYFGGALSESDEIILIGYGGLDEHLNQRVKAVSQGKRLRIVEWDRSGERNVRERFWQNRLGSGIELVQLENILEFVDWNG